MLGGWLLRNGLEGEVHEWALGRGLPTETIQRRSDLGAHRRRQVEPHGRVPYDESRAPLQLEATHVVQGVRGHERHVDPIRHVKRPAQPLEAGRVIGPDEGRERQPAIRAGRVDGSEVAPDAFDDDGQGSPCGVVLGHDSLGDETVDPERKPRRATDLVEAHRKSEAPRDSA